MLSRTIKIAVFFVFVVGTASFPSSMLRAAEPSKDRLIPPIKCVIPSPGWRLEGNESCTIILKNWEKLGFKLETKYAPNWVTFVKMVDSPWTIDAFSSDYNERPDRLEPDSLLTEVAAEQIGPGMKNFFGYNNPEYMKALQASRGEMSPEKRRQLVWKAQEYILKDLPMIPMFHTRTLQPANKKKWDNMVPLTGSGFFNILNFTSVTPKTPERTIILSSVVEFRSLNPMQSPSTNMLMFLKFVYDNLTVVGPDSAVLPWAAKSWRMSDNKTIDVNLREGMMFHDGNPVTSEDVKFSFDFCKQYKVGEYRSLVEPIQKVEIIDKLNVRFVLNEPYAPLLMTTFSTIPILPKHIWENVVEKEKLTHPDQWMNPKPVGSGPFKFSYSRPGEEFALVKNPNHFSAPKADGITMVFPSNQESEFLMWKKGNLDFMDSKGLNPVRAKEASQMDHIQVVEMGSIHVNWMGFNLREGHPTRDYNIRHALAHTIPHSDIIKSILQGKGDAGEGLIAPANKFWHHPNLPAKEMDDKLHIHQYDMEKARKILKDAGFEWDSQGSIYWPSNYEVTVLPK